MRGELEQAGFQAAILDIGAYVNESSPIDVTDLLIALALGANDVLDAPEPGPRVGFVSRLRRLMLRGTSENDLAVQASVQALFVTHADQLKFRSHHMIYTVPTDLQFTPPGALPFDSRMLPVPHVRPRPGQAEHTVARTLAELHDVVSRRLPVDQIFAGKQLDVIIQASGGTCVICSRCCVKVVNLMLRRSLTLPLAYQHVEEAIGLVAHDFMKMTAEQKAFLLRVASGDGTVDPAESEVQLMARLLQSHLLLGHLNGQDWYAVHPLTRRALGLS